MNPALTGPELLKLGRRVVPSLNRNSLHKGSLGRIGVVGGSFEYTGAPFTAAMSAMRTGCDLSFVFCCHEAATPIKSYSPELIVIPCMRTDDENKNPVLKKSLQDCVDQILDWTKRLHALVVGPGLGRDAFMQSIAAQVIKATKNMNIPLIVDGDGIFTVENNPTILEGHKYAILTPNVNEYARLCKAILTEPDPEANYLETLKLLSKRLNNATIVRKGEADIICRGDTILKCDTLGSKRRVGGQGDVLAGAVATFATWANLFGSDTFAKGDLKMLFPLASWNACHLVRLSAEKAFATQSRSMTSIHVLEQVGGLFADTFENNDI